MSEHPNAAAAVRKVLRVPCGGSLHARRSPARGASEVAVGMIAGVSGADASFVGCMQAAGVVDAIARAPGFVRHLSGAASSGHRVIEVRESRDEHRAWDEDRVVPSLPPGVGPGPLEHVDLLVAVSERCTRRPRPGSSRRLFKRAARERK